MPLIKTVAGLGILDCRPMWLGVELFVHQFSGRWAVSSERRARLNSLPYLKVENSSSQGYEPGLEKLHKMAQQVRARSLREPKVVSEARKLKLTWGVQHSHLMGYS